MAKEGDILFMPYNYLMDSKFRTGLGINWVKAVIIFDEAHNVEARAVLCLPRCAAIPCHAMPVLLIQVSAAGTGPTHQSATSPTACVWTSRGTLKTTKYTRALTFFSLYSSTCARKPPTTVLRQAEPCCFLDPGCCCRVCARILHRLTCPPPCWQAA